MCTAQSDCKTGGEGPKEKSGKDLDGADNSYAQELHKTRHSSGNRTSKSQSWMYR